MFLMVLSLLCLGSWAAAFKLGGKWRFEVFYLDFALGLLFAAVVYSFTVGNLGYDGFNFLDDLGHAGKRQWLYVFLAGIIFNLGNMLLMGAISVAGLAVAFPMGMGIAIVVSTGLGLAAHPAGSPALMGIGCALIFASVLVNATNYRMMAVARHEALARAGKAKSTRRPNPVKGIVLAFVAGALIGCFTPLLDLGRQGEVGLGPYAMGAVFVLGVFISSLIFDIFFMNLPIAGDPVELNAFLNCSLKQHLIGLAGGAIWYTGTLAALICVSLPEYLPTSQLSRQLLTQGAPAIAALWGMLVFREFKANDIRVKVLGVLMLVLFTGGLVMLGLAPLYTKSLIAP
jgi:glucose uptake protein